MSREEPSRTQIQGAFRGEKAKITSIDGTLEGSPEIVREGTIKQIFPGNYLLLERNDGIIIGIPFVSPSRAIRDINPIDARSTINYHNSEIDNFHGKGIPLEDSEQEQKVKAAGVYSI